MPAPKVIHQPQTQQALQRGFEQLVQAVAPTLGPLPRRAIAQNLDKFELLDDGGLIARRIIAIPDQQADAGLMLLRQALWKMNQTLGDGTATLAVLFQQIYAEGRRFLAAGCDPNRLRAHLLRLLPPLSQRLVKDARQLRSQEELSALAFSLCYDEAMAVSLGEIIYTLGRFGQVDVRAGHSRHLRHNYVEGSYWRGGAQSQEMLRGTTRAIAEMQDAAILISDAEVEEPAELVPVMQLALRGGIKQLLLVVNSISEKGLSVVLDERLREKIRTIVVKLDEFVPADLQQAQSDIALLTGGHPILQAAGETLADARASDFGSARWVWADDKNFGFASGGGAPQDILATVQRLRAAYDESSDDVARARLLGRLGRMNGGLATLYVGGIAQDEIRQRKDLAERATRALRSASVGGVIPGGGVAMLGCRDWLLDEQATGDEELEARAARQIMAKALEAPTRQLLLNAGYDPSEVLAQLTDYETDTGFDVMRGRFVDMAVAGIVDVAQVQVAALQRAVMSAALALTIDVLVLHREPETMTEP
ncbi:MAG: hypothetical protein OXI62_03590 [Chloroflexota bacterium]|nr:hypothetical protein [Chloroflexota bacterium]MCY3583702.1 hypothetical protein [Chloroflexota bacterium]MDE2649780.1 hypothetical protein [Chloroflexota bacterium]